MNLTLVEKAAVTTIRKSMRKNPEILRELLRDMTYEQTVSILVQAKNEIENLLTVTRAVSEMTKELAVTLKKEPRDETE